MPVAKTPPAFKPYAAPHDAINWRAQKFDLEARIVFDEHSTLDEDDCHNLEVCSNDAERAQCTRAREAWKNDEWFYCGIVIAVYFKGRLLNDHAASLWHIECNYPDSDNSYLSEVCKELESDAIHAAYAALLGVN